MKPESRPLSCGRTTNRKNRFLVKSFFPIRGFYQTPKKKGPFGPSLKFIFLILMRRSASSNAEGLHLSSIQVRACDDLLI